MPPTVPPKHIRALETLSQGKNVTDQQTAQQQTWVGSAGKLVFAYGVLTFNNAHYGQTVTAPMAVAYDEAGNIRFTITWESLFGFKGVNAWKANGEHESQLVNF